MTPAARGAGVLELHLHRGGALPQVPDIRGDADGSLRPLTTMWVVGHDADLYVRSVNGPDGTWYRRALEQREGAMEILPQQHTSKGPADMPPATSRSTCWSRTRNRPACASAACASHPAHAPLGTATPSARPCTSSTGSHWSSHAAATSWSCEPATPASRLPAWEGPTDDGVLEAKWGEPVTDDEYTQPIHTTPR